MLKAGTKRRRTKNEIAAEKEEAKLKNEAIQQKIVQLDMMQQQMSQM